MPKLVVVEVWFDYDRDHSNDLMDVVEVKQGYTELHDDAALEQSKFLYEDDEWRENFSNAVINALTGARTTFGSDQN